MGTIDYSPRGCPFAYCIIKILSIKKGSPEGDPKRITPFPPMKVVIGLIHPNPKLD